MIERVIIDVRPRKVDPPEDAAGPAPLHPLRRHQPATATRWDDVKWSADGKHLAFVSTSRDHKQEWLRVADADDRRCSRRC